MDPEVTQPAAPAPEGQNTNDVQPVAPSVSPAIQSRFDELTGTIHEQRRQMEAIMQTNNELLGRLAATEAQRQQQTQPVEQLPEGVDPALAQFFNQTFAKAFQQQQQMFDKKLEQALGAVRVNQEQLQFQAVTQGVDPKTAKLAQNLMVDWRNKGFTGWTPEDAVTFAEGLIARQGRRNTRDGNDALVPGGGSAPAPVQSKLPPAKSDAELRAMTPAQQEAYWAQRVGDSEIIY